MYFNNNNITNKIEKNKIYINRRKKRNFIENIPSRGKLFTRGDILTINFWFKTFNINFEGICLSLKRKKFKNKNSTLILRNIIFSIGVEFIISYYNNRLFRNTFMSDFKRKNFNYNLAKLYYLRLRENQATKIN